MVTDRCPNLGHCDCGAPLCDEGRGTDIYECVVDGRLHCDTCIQACAHCIEAIEGEDIPA